MITEAYRQLQAQKHALGSYGVSGHLYADIVANMATNAGTTDVLDYGCGQRTLEKALGFLIRNYDPSIPEFSESPTHQADIVVCTDVLEHIEPEYIDSVLDDLQRLTRKIGFFVIATDAANKTLADGRNAHLIQEQPEWWLPKIMARWELKQYQRRKRCFDCLVRPKC